MNGRGVKVGNEYANGFGRLYAKTPKAVFAVVAYSYATWAAGEEAKSNDETVKRFLAEWRVLNENGIVPQKPPEAAKYWHAIRKDAEQIAFQKRAAVEGRAAVAQLNEGARRPTVAERRAKKRGTP